MGLCGSKASEPSTLRVLVLGPGGSGKSTVFKQVKLSSEQNAGFTDAERALWSTRIVTKMLQAAEKYFTSIDDKDSLAKMGSFNVEEPVDDLAKVAKWRPLVGKALSNEAEAGKVLQENHSVFFDDSVKYIVHNVARMNMEGYSATDEDILKFRFPTTGVNKMTYITKAGDKCIFSDVGGQAPERINWNVAGEDADCVLFVHALDDYYKSLAEDARKNRAKESLMLFNMIVKRHFADKPVVLFLNKADLFGKAIKEKPIKSFFPDFPEPESGSVSFDKEQHRATEYFQNLFSHIYESDADARSGQRLTTMVTCAIDTEQMNKIVKSLLQTIIDASLTASGFGSTKGFPSRQLS